MGGGNRDQGQGVPHSHAAGDQPRLQQGREKHGYRRSGTHYANPRRSAQSAPAPVCTDLSDEAIGKTQATVNLNVVAESEAEREAVRQKRQEDLRDAWAPKSKRKQAGQEKPMQPNFVDNPEVPPLE